MSGLWVHGSQVQENKPYGREQAKAVLRTFVIIINLEPCWRGFTQGNQLEIYMCWDPILFKALSLDSKNTLKGGYFLSPSFISLTDSWVAYYMPATVLMPGTEPRIRVSPAFKGYGVGDSPYHRWVPGDSHPRTDQVSEIKHSQVGLSKSQFRDKESWGPERMDKLVKPTRQPGREGEVNQLRFIVHQLCAIPCHQSATDYIWFNAKWPWGR